MSIYACPQHLTTGLIGGPVFFECEVDGGHGVYAADLDREYHPQGATR